MKGSVPCPKNQIEAVLFVEFDNSYGIKLSHQVPGNVIDDNTFKHLENYFITRSRQLYGKLIVTQLSSLQTIGIPVAIPHSNADLSGRNVSIFNIVIVTKVGANTEPYEKILKKLVSYFTIFEQEHRFLSTNGKEKIRDIIDSIYHGINEKGYCSVNVIDELNVIKLSYINKEHFRDPPEIKDSDVPIITADLLQCDDWDLTLRELYPHLDNQKPVRLLADRSLLGIDLVKKCIQSLIYYNLATVISPIQYSNTYYSTNVIHTIIQDAELQEECKQYVKIHPEPIPEWDCIFNLYVTFQSGIKLKRLLMFEKPFLNNINERKLVEFGLLKGILKRLHKYPVVRNLDHDCDTPPQLKEYIASDVLDGQHSFDDISVKLKCKLNKVKEDLEFCKYVTIIQKLGV